MKEYVHYFKKFDPITLVVLCFIWYNLNTKFDTKFNELDKRVYEIERRISVIETIMLLENRLPSHVAEGLKQDKTT